MELVEVLDARGRVVAAGYCCDLCDRLRARVDTVDLGLAERGVRVCDVCFAEWDGWVAGRDSDDEPQPADFETPAYMDAAE